MAEGRIVGRDVVLLVGVLLLRPRRYHCGDDVARSNRRVKRSRRWLPGDAAVSVGRLFVAVLLSGRSPWAR